ncbi:diguanylate cyclase [Alteromonas sp. CYL-A6]|uniref:diguanylate cyclase n=1 Tax=Alteromonas nitratireducens TaxID=3390813 RepID=UPI0034B659EE
MKVVLLAVFAMMLMPDALANTPEHYEQERTRLLNADSDVRKRVLLSDKPFDTQTPLGKHFYNTLISTIPGAFSRFTLTTADQATLKHDYPKYFLEYTLYRLRTSDRPLASLEGDMIALADQAKTAGWDKLYRLAMAEVVDIQLARNHPFKALLTLSGLLQAVSPESATYLSNDDYSQAAIYADLATAQRQSGNAEKAIFYCSKYERALTLAGQQQTNALCRAGVYLSQGDVNQSLRLASEVFRVAAETNDMDTLVEAGTLLSRAYLASDEPAMAETIAKDTVSTAQQQRDLLSLSLFPVYEVLKDIYMARGEANWAGHYLAKMESADPLTPPYYRQNRLEKARAAIASLNGDVAQAASMYEGLLEAHDALPEPALTVTSPAIIDKELQERELTILSKQQEMQTVKTRNLTVVTLFSTTVALICIIAVVRLYRHKQRMESFTRVDQLTSVDNRWFAIQSINRRIAHMDRLGDMVCVALIDIDRFKLINERYGYQTGDKVLARIAKVLKYQLRREDVIGRYGGEEFIVLLSGSQLEDGLAKINELREVLAAQQFAELEDYNDVLRFSCGIVEVSRSAKPEDVISLCDSLLGKAKQKGRNQTCSARFHRPLEVVSA